MRMSKLKDVVAASEQPTTVTIYMPSGEPYLGPDGKPCTITHTGKESKAFVAGREAIQRRMLRQRKTKLEPADLQRNRIDQAAAPVTAWSGWTEDDEVTPAALNTANLHSLLSVEHILEQLEESIEAHGSADFFTSSSPS